MLKLIKNFIYLPWYAKKWSVLYKALGTQDWNAMARAMQDIHDKGFMFETDSSYLYLGFAYAKLECYPEAIAEFKKIEGTFKFVEETIIYCNWFAYALSRNGNIQEAIDHVKGFSKDDWPEKDREWAISLINRCSECDVCPNLPSGKPRVLH